MKSTLRYERVVSADFIIEHPDEWTAEQVEAAATERAIDIAERLRWWNATQRTSLVGVDLGVSQPPEDRDGYCSPCSPEPFALEGEDLTGGEE